MWIVAAARAEHLANDTPPAAGMLRFYATLLHAQAAVDLQLRGDPALSGNLTEDLPVIRPLMIPLLQTVAASGPQPLVSEARALCAGAAFERDQCLLRYWRAPSGDQFFAKAFLQPYVSVLARIGVKPLERNLPPSAHNCPFCAGRPQLAVLAPGIAGDAAPGRSLLCATCLTIWPFRRLVCAHCGEDREGKLPYFHSADHDPVRIEACDTCRHYLKGIDLSRLGLAVPLVDEAAAAVLDVWARERGYTKIELNLVGM